jgi:phosphoribosylformylglycinamidine synthase subunit PurL
MASVLVAPEPVDAGNAVDLHRRLGLTDFELAEIVRRLGRDPNELELAVFSVMWSEHCSYKSSKPLLRQFFAPGLGRGVLAGPGENAGAISIGEVDGEQLAVVFKIESHNHPSAVEPYQGAATGVGGILRDVFAMGARPIAVLDALRFGDPTLAATRRLVDGVVRGVGGYGNCVGIPTVGGELVFHPAYGANPLVNVMAVGLLRGRPMRAVADNPGDLLVLYGATTGRDGIGGASVLASATFGDDDASKRTSVQVGDPFVEKLILEVTLELVERGLVEGVQDLGAGGLSCAVSEMVDRGGTGAAIDLDAVPRRQEGMAPFEVMISESQERMVVAIRPGRLDDVLAVCRRWGLPAAAVIGRVTADGLLTVVEGGIDEAGRPQPGARMVASIPARALASEAIVHQRIAQAPAHRRHAPAPGAPLVASDHLPERGMDPGAVLRALIGRPGLGSVRWVTEQYDATVGTDTIAGAGGGAAVLRVKDTTLGLVLATDGNATVSALDPYLGAALSVCQAVRNVVVTGARPLGITDCLNFGDPEKPEAFWQLSEAVRGIADACRALDLPVVSGNVSLYNESPAGAILPTPQIGAVGLLHDVAVRCGPAFAAADELVILVGEAVPGLAGSAYAALAGNAPEDRPPSLDLTRERALHEFLLDAIAEGLLTAAQDVGEGGLAVALAEMTIWGGIGAELHLRVGATPAVDLFGEGPSRAVVTCKSVAWRRLLGTAGRRAVPLELLGATGGERLHIDLRGQGYTGASEDRGTGIADPIDVDLASLRHDWESALPRLFGGTD